MAILLSLGGTGLERTTGLVPASGDHSFIQPFYIASLPGVGELNEIFYYGDDPQTLFVDYVWLSQRDTSSVFQLAFEVSVGAVATTVFITNPGLGWHIFWYRRTGNVHELFIDGILAGTITVDITGITVTNMYLMTDTFDEGVFLSKSQYFREWDSSETETDLLLESESAIALSSAWCDTPLVSNLLDISGNARNWANFGTGQSFVASFTPGSYNNWYVNNVEETPYLPAVTKGGWNAANNINSQNVLFDPRPQFSVGESITPQNMTENNATNPYEVCLIRLITLPLATQTISGSINMVLGLLESNSAADFYTKVYAWVTVGDSDTNRGTLLDYEETSGSDTEWPTTATGVAFTSRQALNSVDIADGDRIVIEFGFRKLNASATLRTGTLYKGSSIEPGIPVDDLTVGSTNVTTEKGYFNFLIPPVLSTVTPTNVTWDSAETLTFPVSITVDPVTISINLWYKYTADGSENGGISIYAGVSGVGDYLPHIYVWSGDDVTYPSILQMPFNNTWLEANQKSIMVPMEVGVTYYFQIYDDWALNPPGRDLVLEGIKFPYSYPTPVHDKLFVPVDRNILPLLASRDPGGIIDTDGTILWIDFDSVIGPSEFGAVFRKRPYIGNILTEDNVNPGQVFLRNNQLVILDTITGVTNAAGDPVVPINISDAYFYVGQIYLGVFNVRRLTGGGSIASGSWMIPIPSGWDAIMDMCPTKDDTLLYILATSGNLHQDPGHPIKTYNLNTNSFDADFYALGANETSVNMWGLADGTFVVGIENEIDDQASLRHLSSDGTLFANYDLDFPSDGLLHHIIPNANEDAVWTWQQKLEAGPSNYKLFTLKLIRLSDGVTLITLPNVRDFEGLTGYPTALPSDFPPSGQEFGVPTSCPLLVMLEDTLPPINEASGIYKIIPNSFKSNDTLWVSFDPIETEDVKIPRPFARTGLIGE